MTIERDVLDRLEGLGRRWFVTGSWALAAYAEPRMTRDIDVVIEASSTDYEAMIRPTFDSDFLVNDPIDLGGRWMGGLIHRTELVRVDLMFGRADAMTVVVMTNGKTVRIPAELRQAFEELAAE